MAEDEPEDELEEGEDADLDEDGEEGEEGEDGEEGSQKGGRRKLLLIVALAFLLVIGGVGASWWMGFLDPVIALLGGTKTEESEETVPVVAAEAVFFDLPELLVNLNTGGRKSTFLKIRISLEVSSLDDVARVEQIMPRIIDNFQVYLRELRVDDLKGSAGMYRLREELLTRVSAAVAPAKINDVLFKEMLVQ